MTLDVPRLSFSLDPLIGEAKRRARMRRLLLTVAVLGAATAAVAGTLVLRASDQPWATIGAPPTCRIAQLQLSGPTFNGAFTGHSIANFAFTNVSQNACGLRGWPTISVLVQGRPVTEAKGNWRGKNATSTHQLPVETVALAPGHSAAFNVVYVDRMMVQHPRCVPFHAELITPPGVHRPLKAPEPSGKFCGLGVTVSPVVPGQIDRYMIG